MFYSQFILAKKGPLGTIWIAAHLERKLRKNQVADTDIGVSVDSILFPEMPIALRLSSHLLLGVVRIYSRKVNYLFDDCSEALLKVKQAFRSTAVDLPPEESTAPYHSITLPETFDLDDFELPDSEIFQGNYVDQHISSKDQITLQDTMDGVVFSTSKFGLDERFGDGDDASGMDLDEELLVEKAATAEHVTGTSNSDVDPQASGHANAGIVDQQVEDYDEDNEEPVDYAQAPRTPGLWEEPNLSNIQETSACDDHQEPENHTIPEFAVKENLENASSKEAYEQQQQQQNQFELHEKSLPQIAETEQLLMNDVNSVADDPAKLQDLQNENFRDGPPGFQTLDLNHDNCVEYQENLAYKDSGISVQSPHESIQNSDLSTVMPGVMFQNHVTNAEGPPASETYMERTDSRVIIQPSQENMPNYGFPILKPCVTFQNHEINEQGPYATEAFQKNFPEIVQNVEVQVASSLSNRQVENPFENAVQVNNDYPAREKLLSLPQDVPEYFAPETTPTENDITISGKKRSFTESSLTGQSLNLNESSGFNLNFSSGQNLNESSGFLQQSVMNDDDLLSSILVGRKSSILKMKPTPPVQPPTAKRQRRSSAPKTGILKRKVVMDDNMVLHGDTIRQQLTNTEDIRRLRKKAPCTRAEISMLEKQFWEDELFTEPILTGVSIKLASLYNHAFDLRKVVILGTPIEDVIDPKLVTNNDMQLNISKEIGIEDNSMKNVSEIEIQPVEFNQTFDNNNLDYYGGQSQTPIHEPGNVVVLGHDLLGQETAMEIDPKSFPETEIENLVHDDVAPHDTSATLGELEPTNQMDAPGVISNEKTDLQPVEIDNIETSIIPEITDNVAPVTEEKHDQENADVAFDPNFESNAQNLVYNGIFGEDFATVGQYDTEINPVMENVSLDERENHDNFPVNNLVDDDEFTHPAVEHDTDFLNFDDVDDDGEAEDGGDYAADVAATRVIDNSGWSSRTKAVAKYLQIMFDKEGERGRNMLPVNNLLIGKTRKEASRMFFETLVLKTKDYIHVEQADPYENINVFPRAKLLKSDF